MGKERALPGFKFSASMGFHGLHHSSASSLQPKNFFKPFLKTNSKFITGVFLFSNLNRLPTPKSVARPKHAAAPHASALQICHVGQRFSRGNPYHATPAGAAALYPRANQTSTARCNLRKIISFSYDLG
jgi:hypothetical protein